MSENREVFNDYKVVLNDGKEFLVRGVLICTKESNTQFVDRNGNSSFLVSNSALKYAVMR